MYASWQSRIASALGICLLGAPLLRLAWTRLVPEPETPSARPVAPLPHTASGQARRAARQWRARAQTKVNRQREALEAWDPEAVSELNQEAWRLQLMAHDAGGELRRALELAYRAAALARNPDDAFASTVLLMRLECEAGHHEAELRHARTLLRL